MAKAKRPRDINRLAKSIVDIATGATSDIEADDSGKSTAAIARGRLGGKKGGKARAEKMTPEQRKQSARKAAVARWSKTKTN